jgi:8-amino-7-oxononanoate synthase/acyl carrier protein
VWNEVIDAIRRDVTTEHELPPDAVILVRSGSIPKTSSGKIQRHACRQWFLEDSLLTVARRCEWEQEPQERRRVLEEREIPEPVAASEHDDAQVLQAVMQQVRAIARERARDLHPDYRIVDLGLDSLERMEIINALEETFGGELPEEVLPRIDTPRQVAQAIVQHLGVRRVDQPGRRRYRTIPPENYRWEQMTEYVQLKRTLALLQATGLPNPYFPVREGVARGTSRIEGRERIDFAHCNYLGMSGDPFVTRAAQDAIAQYGTSVSASRLVAGQNSLHAELEDELSAFLGTERALVFLGAHSATETTIGHLFGPGDLILHDALAHNSTIQGAILSGARRRPFPHNDWQALDQVLRELRYDYRRVLIAIEGVYAMNGDSPDLPQFVAVKRRHKAFLLVDETHSLGTLGPTGRGIAESSGVDPTAIDLWMGTLSHALGSCGGYVAGARELVEYLQYTAPGFIHSVGLAPPNAAAARAALKLLIQEPERARRCIELAQRFRQQARQAGLDIGPSQGTPIVPVIVGSSVNALQLARALFERTICAQAIVYPAVEESGARLRFFLHATHSPEQVDLAVSALADDLDRIQPSYFERPRPGNSNGVLRREGASLEFH